MLKLNMVNITHVLLQKNISHQPVFNTGFLVKSSLTLLLRIVGNNVIMIDNLSNQSNQCMRHRE